MRAVFSNSIFNKQANLTYMVHFTNEILLSVGDFCGVLRAETLWKMYDA